MEINALPLFEGTGNTLGYLYLRRMIQNGLEEKGVTIYREHEKECPVYLLVNNPPAFQRYFKEQVLLPYTMFETSLLPSHMIQAMAGCDVIITPSRHNWKAMADSGLGGMPIHVVPMGIDPEVYGYIDRPQRKEYTFLWCGAANFRKGFFEAVRAFNELNLPNSKFILKTTRNIGGEGVFQIDNCTDPNVYLVNAKLSIEALRELYQRADCFVFPSKGEADIGLTTLEAMATGLPCIATEWLFRESDYPDYYYPIKYELKKANYNDAYWGYCGDWAVPKTDSIKEQMVYAYEHRTESLEMGRAMSEWVHANRRWEQTIKGVYKVLEGIFNGL